MKNISKVIAIILSCAILLPGCEAKKTPIETPVIPEDSPFNTEVEAEEWGNEADFFRLADFTTSMANVSEFQSGEAELEGEHYYTLVVYCHNTSSENQTAQVEVSHPAKLAESSDFEVDHPTSFAEARIAWDSGELTSRLSLIAPSTSLSLYSSEGEISIHDQTSRQDVPFRSRVTEAPEGSKLTIEVEVPAGATYLVFFGLEALPDGLV